MKSVGIIRDLFPEYCERIQPMLCCSKEYGYCNKMVWRFSEDKILKAVVSEGHLVRPWMVNLLTKVGAWWEQGALQAYNYRKNSGHLRTLTLRDSPYSDDKVIILTVSGNPEYALKRSDIQSFLSVCKDVCATVVLRIHQIFNGRPAQNYEMLLSGPDVFRERFFIQNREIEFQVSPSSFLQPNSFMASVIYSKLCELAEFSSRDVLYDLYAGVGVFGMSVAHRVLQVILVEMDPDAAYDARCNRDRLGLDNVLVEAVDVATFLQSPKWLPPTCIFVDPPRRGLGKKVCDAIVRLQPNKILYLSSNPHSQAIDSAFFTQSGYEIETICPIDQFPDAMQMENIVSLKRKK